MDLSPSFPPCERLRLHATDRRIVSMKIPAYWSKATAEDTDRNGSPQAFTCWRSSDQSPEHARESALAAAKRILQNLLAGKRPDHRYGYGDAPLREEVVERFTDDDGALYAAVTRNGYGSLVLNASQAMFIDLDFPATPPGELIGGFFARLFGKSGPSPEQKKEDAVRSRLERFLGEHPGWGFRVYRTCAGIRALATHDVFDPAADATLDVFRVLGTDPLYVRLCKAQACFRTG